MKEKFIDRQKSIKELETYEYVLSSNRYTTFKKQDGERILSIFTSDIYDLKMHSIGCTIIFTPIEKYLQDLEQDWKSNWKPTIKQHNHNTLTGKTFGEGIYEFMPIEITNDENVDKGINLISKFIKQDVNPFFNYWDNITKLLPFLEVEYQDFNAMNKVFMQDSVLKKSILWYLTNHPEKEDFINCHINRLNNILKEKKKNKIVKDGLNKLVSLKELLENETPNYEWKPNYIKAKYDG